MSFLNFQGYGIFFYTRFEQSSINTSISDESVLFGWIPSSPGEFLSFWLALTLKSRCRFFVLALSKRSSFHLNAVGQTQKYVDSIPKLVSQMFVEENHLEKVPKFSYLGQDNVSRTNCPWRYELQLPPGTAFKLKFSSRRLCRCPTRHWMVAPSVLVSCRCHEPSPAVYFSMLYQKWGWQTCLNVIVLKTPKIPNR